MRPFFRAESRAWEVLVLDAETGAELRRLPVADVEAVDLLTSTDRTLVMRQDFSSASFAWVDLTTGVVGRGSIAAPGASG